MSYKEFFIGITLTGSVGLAAVLGYAYGERRHDPLEIVDADANGTIDAIIDSEWKFALIREGFLNDNPTPGYRYCPLTENISFSIEPAELRKISYPLIAQCLLQKN